MRGYRPERVAELIHKELAQRLLTEVKDPTLEPISINHVEVTRDLSRATVRWLPLGGDVPSEALQEAVDRAGRQLRGPIGRALRLRTAPEIVFEVDTHLAEAFRVSALIDSVTKDSGEE